ncbi:MAG: hypothetical protein ACREA3_04720 [Nitrosotalea sp.]
MLVKRNYRSNKKQLQFEDSSKHEDEIPYISFVTVARNDDHGGNFFGRMLVFIEMLLVQVEKYGLRAELIIVDWNPPPDRIKLYQAIPSSSNYFSDLVKKSPCKIRIIEVPPELHQRFKHSDKLPLFQMIGKNVGIKRARGQFVVATNIDVLFTEELIKLISSKSLKSNYFYRIDRYDVDSIPSGNSMSERLEHCKHNIIRINRRDGTFITNSTTGIWLIKRKIFLKHLRKYILSNIHDGIKIVHDEIELLRYGQKNSDLKLTAKIKLMSKLVANCTTIVLARLTVLLVAGSVISPISKGMMLLKKIVSPPYLGLHTNACGDFTLMAREKWNDLHGYPELEMYSFNIDSVMLQMAYQYGLREKVFKDPMRMYHMGHSSGWTPEQQENLFKRFRDKGIPVLSFPEYESLATKMHREKRPLLVNKDDWGLGSENLPETCLN